MLSSTVQTALQTAKEKALSTFRRPGMHVPAPELCPRQCKYTAVREGRGQKPVRSELMMLLCKRWQRNPQGAAHPPGQQGEKRGPSDLDPSHRQGCTRRSERLLRAAWLESSQLHRHLCTIPRTTSLVWVWSSLFSPSEEKTDRLTAEAMLSYGHA